MASDCQVPIQPKSINVKWASPMPTSELSNALNPYASQGRQRQPANEYNSSGPQTAYQPAVQPPQQHVPHVSELQMAIAEPVHQTPSRSRQGAHVLTELVRMVAATQNAQEIERKRRLAWEQEQEAKFAQRQAEMERKMLEMFSELTALRSKVNTLDSPMNAFGLVTPQHSSPALSHHTTGNMQPTTPTSPVSQPTSYPQPQSMFIQGSSNDALSAASEDQLAASGMQSSSLLYTHHTFQVNMVPPLQSLTQDPSPQLAYAESSDHASTSQSSRPKKRKKRRSSVHSSDELSNSSTSSSASFSPRKRKNHHDTRCYTIHHAMRIHLLHMMQIESNRDLPSSHTESTPLGPSEPVRFVWDKTTKQSVHNARMKARVIEDIKDNRKLYKHVSSKEYGKKSLDAAFEQCFVTLRQKYKVQTDGQTALNHKQREENKARKARHFSRRKIKLTNRSDARNKIPNFEHVTFDGALQSDCMSSEESDVEPDPQTSQPNPILRTHGYAWRSTRLLRFYCILDDEERMGLKLKRGVGRKNRLTGSPKEEFVLPPQGVATWMVSRRWYNTSLATHPELPGTMDKLIEDPPGFDWTHFHELGEASADEDDVRLVPQQHQHSAMYNVDMHDMNHRVPQHHYNSGAYINYAL